MKRLFLIACLFTSSLYAYENISDDKDRNAIPAEQEARKNETLNLQDVSDKNLVPAEQEEREKQEQIESDLIQRDDPDKVYDPADDEWDEEFLDEELMP